MYPMETLLKDLVLLNYTREVYIFASIDLFASIINYQFHTYFSYEPDPEVSGVDSLTADRSSLRFYAFPPSSIPKFLKRIKTENAAGILIVTFWPNQPWFPHTFKMLTDVPVVLASRKNLQ